MMDLLIFCANLEVFLKINLYHITEYWKPEKPLYEIPVPLKFSIWE